MWAQVKLSIITLFNYLSLLLMHALFSLKRSAWFGSKNGHETVLPVSAANQFKAAEISHYIPQRENTRLSDLSSLPSYNFTDTSSIHKSEISALPASLGPALRALSELDDDAFTNAESPPSLAQRRGFKGAPLSFSAPGKSVLLSPWTANTLTPPPRTPLSALGSFLRGAISPTMSVNTLSTDIPCIAIDGDPFDSFEEPYYCRDVVDAEVSETALLDFSIYDPNRSRHFVPIAKIFRTKKTTIYDLTVKAVVTREQSKGRKSSLDEPRLELNEEEELEDVSAASLSSTPVVNIMPATPPSSKQRKQIVSKSPPRPPLSNQTNIESRSPAGSVRPLMLPSRVQHSRQEYDRKIFEIFGAMQITTFADKKRASVAVSRYCFAV